MSRTHFTDIGLTGVVWNNISVPTTGITGGGAIAPDYVQVSDDGAGSTGVGAYAFDPAVEDELFISDFDELDGSAFKFNSTMLARVFRDATNSADTYAGDAALLLMDLAHQIDTVGSDDIHTKTPGDKR